MPSWTTFVGLATATGYELALIHRGRPLNPTQAASTTRLRDRGDRRFPAHLDAGKTPDCFAPNQRNWWGWHNIAWPYTNDWVPEHTYWRRPTMFYRTGRDVDCFNFGRVWDDAT